MPTATANNDDGNVLRGVGFTGGALDDFFFDFFSGGCVGCKLGGKLDVISVLSLLDIRSVYIDK